MGSGSVDCCLRNCIQKLYEINEKILFPVLSSRNKTIAAGNKLIKKTAKIESWKKAYEENFYKQYLRIIKTVAEQLETDISTIEMLLFAKAEELVEKVFKDEMKTKDMRSIDREAFIKPMRSYKGN